MTQEANINEKDQNTFAKEIAAWMNEREFFWTNEVAEKFDIPADGKKRWAFGALIKYLLRNNIIICTDNKSGKRQYMRANHIDLDYVCIGFGMGNGIHHR